MEMTNELIDVLAASVKRKGEVPLTNLYLLNILSLAQRLKERREENVEADLNEMLADDRKWGV